MEAYFHRTRHLYRINPKVTINFTNFSRGPKDMIDASVSAITVLEYLEGRGSEVVGETGWAALFCLDLSPIENAPPVLSWPDES